MKNKKHLYIIGNGFDLAHGLKSSYSNFREYLIKNSYLPPDLIRLIEDSDFLQHNMGATEDSMFNTNQAIEFFKKTSAPKEHIDIVERMAQHPFERNSPPDFEDEAPPGMPNFPPNGKRLKEIMDICPFLALFAICLCIDPMDDFSWNKFEENISKGHHGIFYNKTCSGGLDELIETGLSVDRNIKDPSKLVAYFQDNILRYFHEWIIEVDRVIGKEKIRLNVNTENSIFLSFNYTRTLESVYDIVHDKIRYIHGSVHDRTSIHVGTILYDYNPAVAYLCDTLENIHNRNVDKQGTKNYAISTSLNGGIDILLSTKEHNYFHELNNTKCLMQGFLKKLYKNHEERIAKHSKFFEQIKELEEIIVIGHSLCQADAEYFEYIQKLNTNAKWIISYYDQSSLEELKTNAKEIGLKNIEWKYIKEFYKR